MKVYSKSEKGFGFRWKIVIRQELKDMETFVSSHLQSVHPQIHKMSGDANVDVLWL